MSTTEKSTTSPTSESRASRMMKRSSLPSIAVRKRSKSDSTPRSDSPAMAASYSQCERHADLRARPKPLHVHFPPAIDVADDGDRDPSGLSAKIETDGVGGGEAEVDERVRAAPRAAHFVLNDARGGGRSRDLANAECVAGAETH